MPIGHSPSSRVWKEVDFSERPRGGCGYRLGQGKLGALRKGQEQGYGWWNASRMTGIFTNMIEVQNWHHLRLL